MILLIRIIGYVLLSQGLIAEVEISKLEKRMREVSESYLREELKMNPDAKSVTVIKDFTLWKKVHQVSDLSRSYHILEKFEEKDVWLVQYINKHDDGLPKVGNGAGQASLIINTKTGEVVAVWLMPK